MSRYTSKFHISDPGPQELYEYLDTVEATSPSSNKELLESAKDLGHSIGSKEKSTEGSVLGRLGIVEPSDQFQFTELGDSLVDIMYRDRNLFNTVLHFLYYTAFDRYSDRHIFMSYTYREFTNYLYDNSPFDIFRGERGTIVGEVTELAEQSPDVDVSKTRSGVSLSTKSFNNYLQYLTELSPEVLVEDDSEGTGFERRAFCPPELMILAVDHIYKQNQTDYETLLRVTDDTKVRIQQICLLSDDGFDEVTDYAEQAYPFFSKKHDFGLNLRLDREVTLDELQ
jgi:hypothetical protein